VGGDHGPGPVVAGAVAAARELPVAVTLVGPLERVRRALAEVPGAASLDVCLVDSGEAIGMAEAPAAALRRHPAASVAVAAAEVAAGRCDAFYSAGHTGATVVAAYGRLGMIDGVDRPALAATIPTRPGSAVLLDVGATVGCKPRHLAQFAVMGATFARLALGVSSPRVGLLSIGEEETKGNRLTRGAHRLLKSSPLNFAGNVEARDLYASPVDVIVCDGFTGNIALMVSEGLVVMVGGVLAEALSAEGPGGRGSAVIRGFQKRVDHSEYGGVPLLGVAGLALVGHGRSTAAAVRNGIATACRYASLGVVDGIRLDISSTGAAFR
jgi:glycerol-3-phosphate acyltransferase PlsX